MGVKIFSSIRIIILLSLVFIQCKKPLHRYTKILVDMKEENINADSTGIIKFKFCDTVNLPFRRTDWFYPILLDKDSLFIEVKVLGERHYWCFSLTNSTTNETNLSYEEPWLYGGNDYMSACIPVDSENGTVVYKYGLGIYGTILIEEVYIKVIYIWWEEQ